MQREKMAAEENMHITVKGWQKRCEEIQREKVSMEKEYANLLDMMEKNHLKAVEDLETLYDKKLAYENEKFLQLEQDLIEEESKQGEKLKKAEFRHEETVYTFENQFKDEFAKTQKIFQANKTVAENIKSEYEDKLKEIEDEHENEVRDLKIQEKILYDKLDGEILQLTEQNRKYRLEYKEAKDEKDRLKKSEEEKVSEIKFLNHKISDANTGVEALKKELDDLINTIMEKKKKIGKYKFKIADLQKSKHVLSYRTTEMRKNLEPREAQIENLKEELYKLEKEFEGMLQKSQAQNDQLVKKEKKIESIQSEVNKKKDACEKKENLIQRIKMDIQKAIKTKAAKDYGAEMKSLYRNYCTDTGLKDNAGSSHQGVDGMLRQIQHFENTIYQMGDGSEKTVKRRDQEIHRKILENSDLICDFNELKKANKKLESDIYNTEKENKDLLRQKKAMIDERLNLRNVLAQLQVLLYYIVLAYLILG